MSEKNIDEGKKLYSMFCKHCHGEFGAGGGSINHPVYSAVPHYNDGKMLRRPNVPMNQLKAGHIFHGIKTENTYVAQFPRRYFLV